ncbi:MAG: ATP-dependent DNA helicase RecG [Verrucomicrobia bacterium]|nr:ATP-dependent DNA helicase RecG [Verrucomicrobiota bacterium]
MSPPAPSKVPPPAPLDRPLRERPGVGTERAAQFARLGVHTIGDLLLHRPHRYEDRRRFAPIAELRLGEPATVRGQIVALGIKRYRGGNKSVFEFILDDGTARLHCRWWNLPFMQNYFAQGDDVLVYGTPNSIKPRTIDHAETEVIVNGEENSVHLNRIVPIYPLTEGLPQRWLRSLIWRTLAEFEGKIPESCWLLDAKEFLPRARAIRLLHFPDEQSDIEAARQRLALDEFIELQIAIQTRRKNLQKHAQARPCAGDNRLIKTFLAALGFKLTDAQTKVLREIRHDLGAPTPMRRLLQGDVGSGKTVVAAASALMALESGCNVALMAPTEILAQQHALTFRKWFEPLGIKVELRTGSHKEMRDERRETRNEQRLVDPSSTLCIGTHALIEAGFDLENLGLVVIDEQHKFGVVQREQLVRKGRYPHLLVMTATPIPRTLGLTLYGDLDISVIDQLPAGRVPIKTFLRAADKLPKVWAFIRQKLEQGQQAYVVYPRVDDSGIGDLKAVNREFEKLQRELAPHRIALVHGRVKADERERVMKDFRAGAVKVLLATSVIEVGVDVPNATVMLIENAERFGLAQLHQLRGRIGRGAQESYCILVADIKTPAARERLEVLVDTTDGFEIAEADLRLRGVGELLGRDQSGQPAFRFGDFAVDRWLIERARALAGELLASASTCKKRLAPN